MATVLLQNVSKIFHGAVVAVRDDSDLRGYILYQTAHGLNLIRLRTLSISLVIASFPEDIEETIEEFTLPEVFIGKGL